MLLYSCVALLSTVALAQQAKGPCHIQSNGMTCTRNGYFEMTQCTARDCFCVAANTGNIAEETRTGDGRKAPTCSKCHLNLREIFSSSITLAPTAYVPVCDLQKGDYRSIQCHAFKRECWCVDEKTGEERNGTRKPHSNLEVLQCQPSMGGKDGKFPAALNGKKIEYPVGKETCKLRLDRGSACSGKRPQLMYYFDTNHADCFAFEYLGCGGNANRYATKKACHSSCSLPDMFSCSGLVESKGTCDPGAAFFAAAAPPPPPLGVPGAKDAKATTTTTTTPKPLCPEGYRCQMGAFFGFCCPEAVEDFYNREYNPSCPNGGRPLSDNNGDWDEIRLGTNCTHNFCPSNRRCHQGALFAYCC